MPNFDAHRKWGRIISLFVGVLFVVLFYKQISFEILGWKLILIPAVIYFYSNLPDIDHVMGRLRRYTFKFIFLCLALSFILYIIFGPLWMLVVMSIIGVLGLLVYQTQHRKHMHTYKFIIIASIPLIFLDPFIAALAFTSGASHIFIDRLWSNLRRKFKKLFNIRSNTSIYLFPQTFGKRTKQQYNKQRRLPRVPYNIR